MQNLIKSDFSLATFFVLLWNSGFIGAEFGLPYAGTFTLLFWRYSLLTLILLIYLIYSRQLVLPEIKTITHVSIVGILAHGVWLSCALLALEENVPAGIVALVVALQPLATGAFSGLVVGEKTRLWQWLGLIVGFLGVAIAVGTRIRVDSDVSPIGYFIPFGSVIAITIASLLQRRRETSPQNHSSLSIGSNLFYQSSATTLALAIPAIMVEQLEIEWNVPFIATLSWLIIGVSLGAYALMWQLLSRFDATRVASLFYLGPPVTMVMAWIAFGDVPQIADIVGLFVVVAGVIIVQFL
ncbi:DMT family transporter [Euhalothece natronophila Z-M001]|uniref:DMT family transporter n=1 Tax=Euhalothece natronophila Z-M001 TaxID=522448 RepID=A0A5B8NKZ2_9CHRO|nr:DMT family transporter [Euhalothece natronophila]QDZ39638.1 DMT family transporter [Euhalothece natronophila Z-M001]